MKKIALCLMAACMSLSFFPLQSLAGIPGNHELIGDKTNVPTDANTLLARLKEIKDMDRSGMSSVEKKALRKELRSMRHEIRSSHNGIYLSVGAVIIIVLLLILLL
jgi:hypothetical protein